MKSNFLLFLLLLTISCRHENNTKEPIMFRKDSSHSAIYQDAGIDSLHGIKWKINLGGKIFSSPVIYLEKVFIGSSEKFYALDAATGKKLWSFSADGPVHSSPAAYDNMIYFGDFTGKIYAINANDGNIIWTFKATGERHFGAKGIHGMQPHNQYMTDDWDFYLSSPVISKDKIYFGSGNGNVYCLDMKTGSEVWRFHTNDVVHSSPALAYGNIYVGSWDSYFYCLDANLGTKKWDFKTGIDTVYYNQVGIQSSPVISDSTVFFGCRDSHVYALNAISGELIWKKFNNYSWVIASPAVDDEYVYYTTSDSYQFLALNKINGDSIYSLPTKGFGFSSPIMVSKKIYFGVFNGDLVCIDTQAKKETWRFSTEEAIADNLDVLNDDGTINSQKVFADFSYENMPEIMRMLFSVGAILSTPVPYENSLIFGAANGYVYSIY